MNLKRLDSSQSSRDRKIKAMRSLANGRELKSGVMFDFDDSASIEVQMEQDEEEEKHGSKTKTYLSHFFRKFPPTKCAERNFFLKKLFARYKMAIKLTLSATVFLAIFDQAIYWLDANSVNTVAEGFLKIFFILMVGLVYLVLVTLKSKHEYNYYRRLILVIIFGGCLLKILEIENLILFGGPNSGEM